MTHAIQSDPIRRSVTIPVPLEAAARIAAALEETWPAPDAVGHFETGPASAEVFAHYTETPDIGLIETMVDAAADGAEIGPIQVEDIADADWVTISQGKRGKVRAGRFTVHGSHEAVAPSRGAIEIDASIAFGTAHHASTKGCLIALDGILKRYRPKRVLDIGTGSGLLAIAAARFSQSQVIATDNDAAAVGVAEENALLNGTPHIGFYACHGFEHPALVGLRADLVFGNLLKSILLDLVEGFAKHTAPGGLAVLSGITEDQAASVEACYRNFGFVLKKRILLDGWAILVLQRRPAIPVFD
ncbi:50S ribosomal protein L11 methyltransferase [Methyloligella solikamskensis]|uniref:50S ribosomal protein L11 methyltransferase n=1 Tax=Methyloligella solikamskensis TaxID=1177756 RepID=A0ABW3JB89_9HYPH